MSEFDSARLRTLEYLTDASKDRSPKGSIDVPMWPFMDTLHKSADYFTTSSCSGRIAAFGVHAAGPGADSTTHPDATSLKGRGNWLFVSHGLIDPCGVASQIESALHAQPYELVLLKVEPAIVHVRARTVDHAQALLAAVKGEGARESGLWAGAKPAIQLRSTALAMEVPLVLGTARIVPAASLETLLRHANERLADNMARLDRWTQAVGALLSPEAPASAATGKAAWSTSRSVQRMPDATPPAWQRLQAAGGPQTWGAASASVAVPVAGSGQLVECVAVFGGFAGGAGAHGRSNALWVLPTCQQHGGASPGSLRVAWQTAAVLGETVPSPRVRHALTCVAPGMLVLTGGRSSPARAHEDVWVGAVAMDAHGEVSVTWRQAASSGVHAAWSATATLLPDGVVPGVPGSERVVALVGGRDAQQCTASTTLLAVDVSRGTARVLEDAGLPALPSSVAAHCAWWQAGVGLCVWGGLASVQPAALHGAEGMLADPSIVLAWQPGAAQWQRVALNGVPPQARLSAASLCVGGGVFVSGGTAHALECLHDAWLQVSRSDDGSTVAHAAHIARPDALTGAVSKARKHPRMIEASFSTRHCLALVRLPKATCKPKKQSPGDAIPTAPLLADDATGIPCIVHVGGGGTCFSFSAYYPIPLVLPLRSLAAAISAWSDADVALVRLHANGSVGSAAGTAPSLPEASASAAPPSACPSADIGAHAWVLLPKSACASGRAWALEHAVLDTARKIVSVPELVSPDGRELPLVGPDFRAMPVLPSVAGLSLPGEDMLLVSEAQATRGKPVSDPLRRATQVLLDYARDHRFSPDISVQLTKLERVGDRVVMIPARELLHPAWGEPGAGVWPLLLRAAAPHATALARRAEVSAAPTRDSKVQLLAGTCAETTVKEHGISYTFDATRLMFSSGNVTEKARMARQPAHGERLVDLCAGMGYFTIPLARIAGAAEVAAFDWNEFAVQALARNCRDNGVDGRVHIHAGDNVRAAALYPNWANRVLLGMLPSSERAWPTAVAVLSPAGGTLHIHANVPAADATVDAWGAAVAARIATLGVAAGKHWTVSCVHVEQVKSYAPRVLHCVADIVCVPCAEPEQVPRTLACREAERDELQPVVLVPDMPAPTAPVLNTIAPVVPLRSAYLYRQVLPSAALREFSRAGLHGVLQSAAPGMPERDALLPCESAPSAGTELEPGHTSNHVEHCNFPQVLLRAAAGAAEGTGQRCCMSSPPFHGAHAAPEFWRDWPLLSAALPWPLLAPILPTRVLLQAAVLRVLSSGLHVAVQPCGLHRAVCQLRGWQVLTLRSTSFHRDDLVLPLAPGDIGLIPAGWSGHAQVQPGDAVLCVDLHWESGAAAAADA